MEMFSGILVKDPVPMLMGDDGAIHYLVAPLKGSPSGLLDEILTG